MTRACTCGLCAELDLRRPGEGQQLSFEDDWVTETRRLVAEARASRSAGLNARLDQAGAGRSIAS